MRLKGFFGFLAVLCVAGCSPGDVAKSVPLVGETQVLAIFRMVETFQGVRLNEREGFARTVAALKAEGFSQRQLDGVVAAQSQGKSAHGYLFKDIVADESGSPLDNSIRYGLSAVPEKPGSGTSFLLLIDLRKVQITDEGAAANGIGGELYRSTTAAAPGGKWPAAAELAAWAKLTRRSPQEAVKAASELKEKFDQGGR